MSEKQANNPLHGITLEKIVISLHEHYGWKELSKRIDVRCFNNFPSVRSSIKYLRQHPGPRKQVEDLYVDTQKNM